VAVAATGTRPVYWCRPVWTATPARRQWVF